MRVRLTTHCLPAVLALVSQAHAAGGHHAVDDAAILDPGRCQLETWAERENGGNRSLFHIGSACRVGAVELGLSADRSRFSGAPSVSAQGAQIKWAHPLSKTIAAGVVVSAAWQNTAPRFAGTTLVFPMTWQASPTLMVHLNLGRDFKRQESDTPRNGLALEWSPSKSWSFVAERFREGNTGSWRAGARYSLDNGISLDISHARGVTSGAPRWWAAGLSWEFGR